LKSKTAFLFLGVFVLYFAYLGDMPLLDPDEGRYAEIPREMLATGDFVTPRLNGVAYLEKPPLLYWGNALSMAVLGENETGARAFGALCAVALSGVTFWMGASLAGPVAGALSAVFVAASPYVFAIGRINTTDNALAPAMAFSIFAVWLYMSGRSKRRLLLWAGYVAAALAFLSKGLVGIVFPGAVLVLWALLAGRPRTILSALSPVGIALFLAVSLPWVILCQEANPDFLWFFFVHEHFVRFSTTVHKRFGPFWYFLPLVAGGILPWLPFLAGKGGPARKGSDGAGAAGGGVTERILARAGGEGGLLLWCWFLFILLFFSASKSKLPTYVLPLFPPLCVLVAGRVESWLDLPPGEGGALESARDRLPAALCAFVAALLVAGFVIAPVAAKEALPSSWGTDVLPGAAAILAYALFQLLPPSVLPLSRKGRFLGSAAAFALFLLFLQSPLEHLIGYRSSRDAAAEIRAVAAPGDLVAIAGDFRHGLPFYLGRTVLYWGGKGELEYGIDRDPQRDRWYLDDAALARLWASEKRLFVLIAAKRPAEHLDRFPGGRLIWRGRKGILVVNR
jgi:4-amino-4-deoxy-L-arabinose transferase-like glycosyltransferase